MSKSPQRCDRHPWPGYAACEECYPPESTEYFHSLARYEESIRPEGVEDFLEEFIPLVNRYAARTEER